MKFEDFEKLMSQKGINSLAEIARLLETTPQAVSNWKSRNQVPNHIVIKVSQFNLVNSNPQNNGNKEDFFKYFNPSFFQNKELLAEDNSLNLSDLLLILARQFKIIALSTFLAIFLTFSFVQFVQKPLFVSTSVILLPSESSSNLGGLTGLASGLGVDVASSESVDLSSPSLFPDIINSRLFAERLLKMRFTIDDKNQTTLIDFLSGQNYKESFKSEKLIQNTVSKLKSMISLSNEGAFSRLSVETENPILSKDLNNAVLNELQSLNRVFKSNHLSEKIKFIEERIEIVSKDLEKSELDLKTFRENNRQIRSSPSLALSEERYLREVETKKSVFLTLKQQLELAKIEEIQEASIIQILDEAQIPLYPSNKQLRTSLMLALILGSILGAILGFIRNYFMTDNPEKRKTNKKIKLYFLSKSKEFLFDYRVTGSIGLILLVFMPFYIGYESSNPIYFNRYSARLLFVNIIYFLFLILNLILFTISLRKKIRN